MKEDIKKIILKKYKYRPQFSCLSDSIFDYLSTIFRVARFGPKICQIGPKYDKSGTFFLIIFEYILARWAKMYSNLIWKKSRICHICANLTLFGAKPDILVLHCLRFHQLLSSFPFILFYYFPFVIIYKYQPIVRGWKNKISRCVACGGRWIVHRMKGSAGVPGRGERRVNSGAGFVRKLCFFMDSGLFRGKIVRQLS